MEFLDEAASPIVVELLELLTKHCRDLSLDISYPDL